MNQRRGLHHRRRDIPDDESTLTKLLVWLCFQNETQILAKGNLMGGNKRDVKTNKNKN